LKKALETAEASRSVAEKESAATRSRLLDANKQVTSVTQERDTMERERDDALRESKREHVPGPVAKHLCRRHLQKKLAAAESTVREISADRPKERRSCKR
jgi:hypothetical protein